MPGRLCHMSVHDTHMRKAHVETGLPGTSGPTYLHTLSVILRGGVAGAYGILSEAKDLAARMAS